MHSILLLLGLLAFAAPHHAGEPMAMPLGRSWPHWLHLVVNMQAQAPPRMLSQLCHSRSRAFRIP